MIELPTFTVGETLTAEKLNALVEAIKEIRIVAQGGMGGQSGNNDDPVSDPYDKTLIASINGAGTWTEKVVEDGEVVTYGTPGTDGRHCDDVADPSKFVILNGKQVVLIEVDDPPDKRYVMIPTNPLAKITAVSGSFPAWTYTVQLITGYDSGETGADKWTTDATNLTASNRAEFAPDGGTYPYVYGNGVTITDSDGTVNGGSCVIIPIGVGAVVELTFGLDEEGNTIQSFCEMNSAEEPEE